MWYCVFVHQPKKKSNPCVVVHFIHQLLHQSKIWHMLRSYTRGHLSFSHFLPPSFSRSFCTVMMFCYPCFLVRKSEIQPKMQTPVLCSWARPGPVCPPTSSEKPAFLSHHCAIFILHVPTKTVWKQHSPTFDSSMFIFICHHVRAVVHFVVPLLSATFADFSDAHTHTHLSPAKLQKVSST